MYLYKITLTVLGDDFYPNAIDLEMVNDSMDKHSLKFMDSWNPDNEAYGYGGLMFMHTSVFSKRSRLIKFEENFVAFLEENDALFFDSGVREYHLGYEVYYSGTQCNFEILDIDFLKRLKQLKADIAYPVSIYKMKKKQIKDLLIF